MGNDDLIVREVLPVSDGVQWPVQARTAEEAWQIMLRSGITACMKMTRAEFEKLAGNQVK